MIGRIRKRVKLRAARKQAASENPSPGQAPLEVLPPSHRLRSDILGPSPNPATNLAIADIALRGGSMLARQAMERALLGRAYAPRKTRRILRGRSVTEVLLHRTIARMAMRSVPGAVLVGGGLLVKTFYDRRKAYRALVDGQMKLEEMARDGKDD